MLTLFYIIAYYRKHVISSRCFFLSPSSWGVYFNQHIIPTAVTTFNVNHLYWLPGDLLADAIIQMKSLKELGVKDTKVSLSLLAQQLNSPGKLRATQIPAIAHRLLQCIPPTGIMAPIVQLGNNMPAGKDVLIRNTPLSVCPSS